MHSQDQAVSEPAEFGRNHPPAGDLGLDPDARIDNSMRKFNCYIFLMAVGLVAGFLYGFGFDNDDYLKPIDLASSVVVTFTFLFWVYLDAEERRFRITPRFSIIFVFLPLICMPWYIFRTRKGLACLNAFGLISGLMILYLIAAGLGAVLSLLLSSGLSLIRG